MPTGKEATVDGGPAAVGQRAVPSTFRTVDALHRAAVVRALAAQRSGRVTLRDPSGTHTVGRSVGPDRLHAEVTVHTGRAYTALRRGSRGFAESYVAGDWDTDDLVTLVRILARAFGALDPLRARIAALTLPVRRVVAARRHTRSASRDNIIRHYDIGNDVFSLILDETMGYSCAYWERPDMEPAEASRANLERVCRLLDLRAGDRLLEMGSGWGGMAVYAATTRGCHVSTVTISPSQRDYIEALARANGVADRVEVILRDYRDVRGQWDKVVSLEMVESVGPEHLTDLLGQCGRLMRHDGLLVMQAITTTDRLFRVDRYRRTFLNEHIFPGGFLPSLEAILAAAASRTSLRVVAVHDITPHYPPTLRAWRTSLHRNWERIRALGHGLDERFLRLWTLYFAYCEAGFLERRVLDRQIVFAGPRHLDENRLLGLGQQPAVAVGESAAVAAGEPTAVAAGI